MKKAICTAAGRVAGIVSVIAAIGTASAQAPADLLGKYAITASGCAETADGHFQIESHRMSGEGFGCEIVSLRRLWGKQGEKSMFQVKALCQMDDPQRPVLSGILLIQPIMGQVMLGVNLVVEPKFAKKFTYPPLELYVKCHS